VSGVSKDDNRWNRGKGGEPVEMMDGKFSGRRSNAVFLERPVHGPAKLIPVLPGSTSSPLQICPPRPTPIVASASTRPLSYFTTAGGKEKRQTVFPF
jgi:hypothetical protein